jgi:hypothetical protein
VTFIRSSFCSSDGCVECDLAGVTGWATASLSFSNGNCAQVACAHGAQFTTAGMSAASGDCAEAGCTEGEQFRSAGASYQDGNCPEVSGKVLLRDSKGQKLPEGERYRAIHLHYSPQQWDGGRGVQFTPVNQRKVDDEVRAVRESRNGDPGAQWYMVSDGTDALFFDQAEVDAFLDGVKNGEFELA